MSSMSIRFFTHSSQNLLVTKSNSDRTLIEGRPKADRRLEKFIITFKKSFFTDKLKSIDRIFINKLDKVNPYNYTAMG